MACAPPDKQQIYLQNQTFSTSFGVMNRSNEGCCQITCRNTTINMFGLLLKGLKRTHHMLETIIKRLISLIYVSITFRRYEARVSKWPHLHYGFSIHHGTDSVCVISFTKYVTSLADWTHFKEGITVLL